MRPIRVTPQQAAKLLGETVEPEPISPSEPAFSGGSKPGHASHNLDESRAGVRCRECGRETWKLFSAFDGTKVGPWICLECTEAASKKRWKKGKQV